MKVSIVSDIHLEFSKDVFLNNDENSDLLILAGDIGSGISPETDSFILNCCKMYKDVIFVLGNHEFYGFDINDVVAHWVDFSSRLTNLHFLNNSSCEVDGIKFIGSTLFSDTVNDLTIPESLYVNKIKHSFKKEINDFNSIYLNGSKITVDEYNDEYVKSINYITDEINKETDFKKVLITHYATMMPSIGDEFVGSPSRPFFTTDLSNLICNSDLDLVVHGHLHNKSDYEYFGKRVICHPYGYGQDYGFKIKQVVI